MSETLQNSSSFLDMALLSRRSLGSQKVTKEMTAPWEETTLPTILARYELKDIFNADEFGLFYEALPSLPSCTSRCFRTKSH